MDLFYLASYDLDNFRVFVASPFFHDVYDLEPALFQKLLTDEVELLKFAARYLKQVLFGEKTIPEKPDAVEKRMKRRQKSTRNANRRRRRPSHRNTTGRTRAAPEPQDPFRPKPPHGRLFVSARQFASYQR